MQKFMAFAFLVSLLLAACTPSVPPTSGVDATAEDSAEAEITALVEDFGSRLKNVSLLAPDAAQQIEEHYAEFVTPELLTAWQADPTQAPGRLTSSPWPDEIRIYAIEPITEEEFRVIGAVVEVTSADSDILPGYQIEMTVSFIEGHWLISAYHANLEP